MNKIASGDQKNKSGKKCLFLKKQRIFNHKKPHLSQKSEKVVDKENIYIYN